MKPDEPTKRPPVGRNLKRIFGLFGHYPALTAVSVLFVLATTVGQLGGPVIIGWTVDYMADRAKAALEDDAPAPAEADPSEQAVDEPPAADQPAEPAPHKQAEDGLRRRVLPWLGLRLDSVWSYVILMIAVVLVRDISRFVGGLSRLALTQRITGELRTRMFDKVQALGFDYHDHVASGKVIARCTRDVERIRRFVSMPAFSTLELILFLVGVGVFMTLASPRLALVAALFLPPSLGLIFYNATHLGKLWKDVSDRYGALTTVLGENISGARVVKAFAREPDQIAKFDTSSDTYVDRSVVATAFYASRMPFAFFIFGLSTPVVLVLGGYFAIQGQMTVGGVVLFLMYLRFLNHRVRMIGRLIESAQVAAASAEGVFEVLEAEETVAEPTDALPVPEGPGRVDFETVSYHYDGDQGNGLDEIDLAIEPGEKIAVVGPTGSGKSTLIGLMARFRDPAVGHVLLDGRDLRRYRLQELRRSVAIVFQETFLFSMTVRENIRLGRPEATDEDVEQAARAAAAHEFITQLDSGYDTMVGERGVNLSGGQRQRIAIARALIMQPKVLVLDDATASVDSRTETHIREAIEALPRSMTVVVITQRLPSIRTCDRIVVLEAGRIVQLGTHDELMHESGLYAELYASQSEERML